MKIDNFIQINVSMNELCINKQLSQGLWETNKWINKLENNTKKKIMPALKQPAFKSSLLNEIESETNWELKRHFYFINSHDSTDHAKLGNSSYWNLIESENSISIKNSLWKIKNFYCEF